MGESVISSIPRVSATLNALYYGFYVEGLRRAFGRVGWMRPPMAEAKPGLAFVVGDRRVYICAEDSPSIDPEALDWCDVYAKVNARTPLPAKVLAIGPSFGVTAWNRPRSVAAAMSSIAFRSQRRPLDNVADLRRQVRYRLPERALVPGVTDPARVFFAGTIWRREAATNQARAAFLRAVRARPELHLEGGFAPRSDDLDHDFDDLIAPRVDYPAYVEATRRSAFVFNTPAVLDCHGWKLGEFLALGKAIISTPLVNEMPAPFVAGTHFHPADPTPVALDAAIDDLAEPAYRQHLERNARRYYDEYLTPEAVIRRIIGRA